MLNGYRGRLQKELRMIMGAVNVISIPNADCAAFAGGAVVAESSSVQALLVTKRSYEEFGARALY